MKLPLRQAPFNQPTDQPTDQHQKWSHVEDNKVKRSPPAQRPSPNDQGERKQHPQARNRAIGRDGVFWLRLFAFHRDRTSGQSCPYQTMTVRSASAATGAGGKAPQMDCRSGIAGRSSKRNTAAGASQDFMGGGILEVGGGGSAVGLYRNRNPAAENRQTGRKLAVGGIQATSLRRFWPESERFPVPIP